MKQVAKIILISIALMMFGSSHAANISNIEVVDTNTLHVSMEEVKMGTTEIMWDVKVLNDMTVAFTTMNDEDETSSSVTITLDGELQKDTEYSLLTVFGADGSIDFTTSDTIEGVEILNSDTDEIGQSIDSITLLDRKTIEVTYTEELDGSDFEFKLLSDMEVASIGAVDENTIAVNLADKVLPEQNYILMVLALQDALAQDVQLEEGIFDFTSPSDVSSPADMLSVEETTEEPVEAISENTELSEDETEVELNAAFNNLDTPDESVQLLDAEGIDKIVEDAVKAEEEAEITVEHTVESVAMSATATPETGAETWVLIMLTLFINTFYYFSRRKS